MLVLNLNIIIGLITLLEMGFAVLFLKQYLKDKSTMTFCMFLVVLGLLADAFLIAVGSINNQYATIGISRIRFIAHGALIPLMFPICGYALKLNKKWLNVIWFITALIMVAGIAQAFAVKLEPVTLGNTYRYVSSDETPLWAEKIRRLLSFGTVIPIIVSGIIIWIKQKRTYFFLAGLLMFVFSAIGPATGNLDLIFFFSMIGELFICFFFYLNQTK